MSDEGPIVEYLSKKENLPYTLRIASSIDAIRESLLDQFFTQVKHAAREELGSLASRWMPPRDDLSMRRPYFEWPFIENAALYASVQVCGPEEEVRLGVAWRQERPTEELVPDAAQPLHSLLVKEMGPEGETDSWWLRSVSRPGPVDDVCLSAASEGELARDIGRELGRVMAAAESHIEIANKELR